MPLVQISTTESLPGESANEALATAATIVAEETGKPASVVMARLEENCLLSLGEHSEKVALVEIRGIELPKEKTQALTSRFCDWAESMLSIPGDRIFLIAENVPRGTWGFNHRVF